MTDDISGARVRELFLDFFRDRAHAVLPSASLIPENDPSVLFTTAGMHPLVPYLIGQSHPAGNRLASVQKCLRTDDIEEVGDPSHLTFFEMLGNWSLGEYFKEEAIDMSAEFLMSDHTLGIPVDRLAITCFEGDASVPRDVDSASLWQHRGIPRERIFFFGRKENWWGPAGQTGPCGPDTEMFYDTRQGPPGATPNDDSGRFVEIWNDVFMEYEKRADGSYGQLSQRNVDTGMGLERTVTVLNSLPSVYDTDLFRPIVDVIYTQVHGRDERLIRIAADHLRASVFVLSDRRSVVPSNVEQGYVLRRLIRRACRSLRQLGAEEGPLAKILVDVSAAAARTYGAVYPEVAEREAHATEQLLVELQKYLSVEQRADKILEKYRATGQTRISSTAAFDIYQETGIHPELLRSFGAKYRIGVDMDGLEKELEKHQETSRAGITQRFAGGLADHSAQTVKYHTATHLLHAALRRVLGSHVEQRGSNITPERLRFDFSHPHKLTGEELRMVEALVNEQIERDVPVRREIMSLEEAAQTGALGFFVETYGSRVSVYSVGDFSKEICGGPHVAHTRQIGRLRIVKEEGLAAGIRRIRAVVE